MPVNEIVVQNPPFNHQSAAMIVQKMNRLRLKDRNILLHLRAIASDQPENESPSLNDETFFFFFDQ